MSGGLGCVDFEPMTGFCVDLARNAPFDDLWELDLNLARLKMPPFRRIEYQPALGGLIGPMSATPPGEGHRLFMVLSPHTLCRVSPRLLAHVQSNTTPLSLSQVGGSKSSGIEQILFGYPPPPTVGTLRSRDPPCPVSVQLKAACDLIAKDSNRPYAPSRFLVLERGVASYCSWFCRGSTVVPNTRISSTTQAMPGTDVAYAATISEYESTGTGRGSHRRR
eukprot:817474-Rhodomonas_salina.1